MKKLKPHKNVRKFLEKNNIKVGNLFVAIRDDKYTLIEKDKIMMLCNITHYRDDNSFSAQMLFENEIELMRFGGVEDFYHFFLPVLTF